MTDFTELCRRAAGFRPYDFQRRIAREGLPDLLRVPTGAGKTAAAVLGWLWRRRFHPDPAVRQAMPHWLVLALPLRTLVEQAAESVRGWLDALGLRVEVPVHVVMGGEGRAASEWRRDPTRDAVFVGSIDMLVSRALNHGYAMSRFAAPIDFGMFNSGCQWVFDEIQLLGPALPTSRQLQAFREHFGTALSTHTMWMSATAELDWMHTVDASDVDRVVELGEADRSDERLMRRMEAKRTVAALGVGAAPEDVAEEVLRSHRDGTRTIVMVNTVARAQELHACLRDTGPDAEVVLVHSRFRPPERAAATQRALEDPTAAGAVVVTTQAFEAGVDVTSATLVTEAASWPSIVQRAGRCNRYGEQEDARLLWIEPPDPAPYPEADVAASVEALRRLEDIQVTGEDLAGREVETTRELHVVLRRKDLLELFDTAPDLSGNEVDVGRFIRDTEDIDVRLAWRNLGSGSSAPARLPDDTEPPTREELCPAPVGSVRGTLRRGRPPLWRFDALPGQWIRCTGPADVRPGMVLLADTSFGRYAPDTGWTTGSRAAVEPVTPAEPDAAASVGEGTGDDVLSRTGVWVGLADHLRHVEQVAGEFLAGLSDPLSPGLSEAVTVAARLHDVGKAHPVFQDTMVRSAGDDEQERAETGGPWAKSSRQRPARHSRRGFRHELAGALALLDDGADGLLEGVSERELVIYLVAAHHGRVRLGIRAMPDETGCPDDPDRDLVLGVCDGETLPAVDVPDGRLPSTELDLEPAALGGPRSWTGMALALRDRPDLGVFRLGFLEAIVRLADWRASADEEAGLR